MQVAHHIGPGVHQDLVTTLVAPEVVQGQIAFLQIGAHGPVENDDALGQEGQKGIIFDGRGEGGSFAAGLS